jgi:hypothetical protein
MLDIARSVFILTALVVSARARYVPGIVSAFVCAFVVGLELYFALRFPVRPVPVAIAFGAVFIGPSAMPHEPPFAASGLLMNPLHHLFLAGVGAGATRGAFSRASELRPETIRARRLDGAGLRFVAISVVHGLLAIAAVARG